MADYGITDTGFTRKTYDELINEAISRAQSLFGSNIQISEDSFFGQLIRLYVYYQEEIWQLAEDAYNNGYIDTAEGVALDALVKFINISRNQATAATGTVTFTGDEGTLIPSGTLLEAGSEQFTTDEEATIATGETTVDVAITAVDLGTDGNVGADTITELVNPISGIDSVTNTDALTDGDDEETDSALNARYYEALQAAGKGTVDAIRSDILQVTGVQTATIIENDTDATVDDIPPHSFEAVVDGGTDSAVAQAILESKPVGIGTYGTTTVSVDDDSGTSHDISFSRPTSVTIYVNATLTVTTNYPTDGDTTVQEALVDYINALEVGADVIVSQLVAEIFSTVSGVDDATVELSTDGVTYAASNISIGTDESATTSTSEVSITSGS